MKKLFRIILCAVFSLALCFAFTASAYADETYNEETSSYDFLITDYDFTANVSENNVYDITETIDVTFLESGLHGIYRDIPVNQQFLRDNGDGTQSAVMVPSSVWDIRVDDYPFHTDTSYDSNHDNYRIYIGDSDKTVTGEHVYKLHYKLGFGDDQTKDYDEAYFNVLGTEWDNYIDHFTFSVTLPKAFDAKKLGFSFGPDGASGYDPGVLKFNVDGNTISGEVKQHIRPYTGLTMRLELPDGYFKVPDIRVPDWILMGVIGCITLLAVVLFLLYGRDKMLVKTVEFEPPENMTPPELAYVLKGTVTSDNVVSLIVYWADKGYLKITEEDSTYRLDKLKDMGGEAREYEKSMFRHLFRSGPSVYTDDLKYHFYTAVNNAVAAVKRSFDTDDRRIFTKKSLGTEHWINFFLVLPCIIVCIFALGRLRETGWFFAAIMGSMGGVIALLPFFCFRNTLRNWQISNPKTHLAKLIASLAFTAGFFTGFVLATLEGANEPLLPWTAIAATFILGVCSAFASKRTDKGNEWLGKALGFRDFIQYAEADRLKMLVEQNPGYFYHILPYAFVLGISDKWIRNFEGLGLEPPDWYASHTAFSTATFMHSFNTTMTTISTHMNTAPASSSSSSGGGSGFSGGGFSGGGGGGGGGGSW